MNDWGKSITVIVVFMVIMTNMVFSVSAKSVQDNWPVYRCNPLMMPFAASFAPEGSTVTTEENFSYCIQDCRKVVSAAVCNLIVLSQRSYIIVCHSTKLFQEIHVHFASFEFVDEGAKVFVCGHSNSFMAIFEQTEHDLS
jgi:hypothetical protein